MPKLEANKQNCTNTPEDKRQNNPSCIKINRFYFVLRAVWPNFVENIGTYPVSCRTGRRPTLFNAARLTLALSGNAMPA